MIILGITGPTGAGKTTVSKIFRMRGVEIIDTDILARQIVEKGQPALSELVREFGEEILNETGNLKRAELARIAFSDEKKLAKLNSVTHKYIKAIISERIKNSSSETIGIDGAALFESGVSKMCDFMICVTADDEIRLKRIIERDSISEEAAKRRMDAQKNILFYLENSDFIVYNNGREDPEKQIDDIEKKIKRRLM